MYLCAACKEKTFMYTLICTKKLFTGSPSPEAYSWHWTSKIMKKNMLIYFKTYLICGILLEP